MSREQLRALVQWAERLEAPGFSFGHWVRSEQRSDNAWTMPYFDFSPEALEFLRDAPVLVFDWPEWLQTDEAQRLMRDHAVIAAATDDQLLKLLTTLIRGDRFSEGTLANAYESDLLAAIARRAKVLTEGDDTS